jgi:hypothetical protein
MVGQTGEHRTLITEFRFRSEQSGSFASEVLIPNPRHERKEFGSSMVSVLCELEFAASYICVGEETGNFELCAKANRSLVLI